MYWGCIGGFEGRKGGLFPLKYPLCLMSGGSLHMYTAALRQPVQYWLS